MGSDMGKKSRGITGKAESGKIFAAFVAGAVLSTLVLVVLLSSSSPRASLYGSLSSKIWNNCEISFGKYKGQEYSTTSTVRPPKCLVESKFLKVQQHAVQFEQDSSSSNKNSPVIDDWLWIDYHDRINVLIEVEPTPSPRFLVFEQTKYALEGRDSLAIVGGIIEPGEKPDQAAHREVLEEASVDCRKLQFLGRFRTDVNRGMGWTHTYLARECHKATASQTKTDIANDEEVGVPDTERQEQRIMGREEVRTAVRDGKFLEIQWSATVALALLYYDDDAADDSTTSTADAQ